MAGARRLQHRDVSEPIERICREFLDAHGVAAIHHGELTRPLIDHVNEVLSRAMGEAYQDGADAANGRS